MTAGNDRIQHQKIVISLKQLVLRIEERFPGSGLLHLANDITADIEKIPQSIENINHAPKYIGFLKLLVILLIFGTMAGLVSQIEITKDFWTAGVFSQVFSSLVQLVVYLSVLVIFVFSYEKKIKLKKALSCINSYREFAHLIDLHQLAKDPATFMKDYKPGRASRKNELGKFSMSRYLAYCNELLSLLGKATALYVHNFPDEALMAAADQIEDLTTGLSIRIWQKNSLLNEEKSAVSP